MKQSVHGSSESPTVCCTDGVISTARGMDVICDAMIAEREAELSFSPGFRWGTTVLPGDNITVDDLYNQTSMNYPSVYRLEFTWYPDQGNSGRRLR